MSPEACLLLATQLAPELAGKLEVIRHTKALGPTPEGRLAWCCAGRHLGIRDELRKLGRWQGHWPSTVIFVAEPTLPVLLHELSHLTPARPVIADDGDEPTADQRQFQEMQLQRFASMADTVRQVPWAGHDVRYTRRAIHLLYRAERLGYVVGLNDLNVAGDRYRLSHVSVYADRFASEPRMNVHRSFGEIDGIAFPDPVLRLFADDVRLWAIDSLIGETNG
jgi:hypothetical protein